MGVVGGKMFRDILDVLRRHLIVRLAKGATVILNTHITKDGVFPQGEVSDAIFYNVAILLSPDTTVPDSVPQNWSE